ncbi:hypothetical protein MKW94_021223 [Papaver nudicaule]|uniref:Uncharacterized protein n=1 Tax=Papaver nudicaule TaxID=74823 RepID=A0AA42B3V9_PAPNU|nr:hypothetical protein [Papaver nudicaule]
MNSSGCISSCVKDVHLPVRATYLNVYKWPESDAEFVKSVSSANKVDDHKIGARPRRWNYNSPRVVDSISCRQMYLRSYTFTKKETVQEKTKKCFGKVKEKVNMRDSSKKYAVMRRVKEISLATLVSIFHRLLTCTASVDVVDNGRKC